MNLGEMPDHIKARHPEQAAIGSLDDAVLPIAPPPLDGEVLSPQKETRDAVLDSSAKLDEITELAMSRLKDALLDPPADLKEAALQMDAIRIALTTQLRVDDSRLKKRQTDTLKELLARMDMEDAKLVGAG